MATFAKFNLVQESTVTTTTIATATPWVPLAQIHPFTVGFGVNPSAAAGNNFTVQHTFDDVLSRDVATSALLPVAFDHPTVSGKSAKIDGNYAFPVAAIRLIINSADSAARGCTFWVRQGDTIS